MLARVSHKSDLSGCACLKRLARLQADLVRRVHGLRVGEARTG
jgi:hypothetical protein